MSIVQKLIAPNRSRAQQTGAAPCLLFVLLLLISHFPAIAGIAADPAPLKEITVVSDDNYPPFIFRDGEGHLQGILVDQRRLWKERTGIKVESMASHRPYRPAWGIDAALEEISKNRGILYDPEAADAYLRLLQKKGYRLV